MENSNLINELYKKNKQKEKYETTIKELWKQVQDLQQKGSQENRMEREIQKANEKAVDF